MTATFSEELLRVLSAAERQAKSVNHPISDRDLLSALLTAEAGLVTSEPELGSFLRNRATTQAAAKDLHGAPTDLRRPPRLDADAAETIRNARIIAGGTRANMVTTVHLLIAVIAKEVRPGRKSEGADELLQALGRRKHDPETPASLPKRWWSELPPATGPQIALFGKDQSTDP